MKIWIIAPQDAIPGDTWGHKHGMYLSKILASHGHEVVFWVANYSHATKTLRGKEWEQVVTKDGIKIILVPVCVYENNIGFMRIKSLLDFARNLWRRGKSEASPDAIFLSIPTPFIDVATVLLAKKHRSSLIIDFRDLWPELFESVFPPSLRNLGRLILKPLYWCRSYAFNNATGLASVCIAYQNLAFKIAPQLQQRPHIVLYHTGVELEKFRILMNDGAHDAEMRKKGNGEIWAIYAGTLGNNYDIRTLLEASHLLLDKAECANIHILIAGDGPMKQEIITHINNFPKANLHFLGTLDAPRLYRYYKKSDIGLSIYSASSTVGIPAKAYDYYAACLPIVNSIQGEFSDYLAQHKIGVPYKGGDPQSLADAIALIASDRVELENMKSRLYAIAPEYDRDIQYSKVTELLGSAKRVGSD